MFAIPGHADTTGATTLGNWFVKPGTTVAPTAGPDGSFGYDITNVGTGAVTAVLNDKVNTFTTVAGSTYTVDAWVRTPDAVGTSVGLRQMEYRGSSLLGQAQSSVWLNTTAWRHLVTSYTAKATGATIDVNSLAWSLPRGKSFQIGKIVLSALGSGSSTPVVVQPPGGNPTPAPTSNAPSSSAPTSAKPTTPAPTSAKPTAPAPTTPAPTTPAPTIPAPTTPAPTTASSAPAPSTGVPAGYHLVWSDEFNGSNLDTSSWNALNNSTYGDGNGEQACLMSRQQNIDESNGILHLTARHESTPITCGSHDTRFPNGRSYTSAMITTQGKRMYKYGYFVIRAKLPTEHAGSKGFWPAFWMRPASGSLGELDILEAIGSDTLGATNSQVSQTAWYDYNGTYPKQGHGAKLGPTADGFHTFGIKWAPGLMQWIVDGQVTYTLTSATTPWLDKAFGQEFFFRINLAVGGSWPGSPSSSTTFPSSYDLDYIRVYQQ
jgi:beta-glucanase (GH16 family)